MRIAQIAPIIERVPPKQYGGTERVVSALTEELVRRGHEVTLFGSGDSITKAKLISAYPRALREARLQGIYGPHVWTMMNIGLAYAMEEEFDIIHDHNGHLSIATANLSKKPVVMTYHGPMNGEVRRIFGAFRRPNLVSISNSQRAPAPDLNYVGTVYNGLQMKDFPFSEDNEGYLLFVGRISMEKGTHLAIEVAQELDLPLIIAAKLETVDKAYFSAYVEPHLSSQIQWIGEVDEEKRNQLMSKAKCFLHPITWREPFGLTMIEAMACGCPVVGINHGSVPEIIKNGETGYVVDNVDGMVEAVSMIEAISRKYCREYALENFSAKKMTDGYETVYKRLLLKTSGSNKQKKGLNNRAYKIV